MNNRYNHKNRRKYSLRAHVVLVTKYRKNLLKDSIADVVKQRIAAIAKRDGLEIIATETDNDHIHFLLGYDTISRLYDIIKTIKQEKSYYLWQRYAQFLSKHYWKKVFGSYGYFVCGIGKVYSATIERYIA